MKKRGRKTEMLDGMKCMNFTIDQMTLRLLKALGGGNASRGVREAARVAYAVYQKT